VALNKMDLPEARRNLSEVQHYFKKIKKEVYPISALNGEGLPKLLALLSKTLSQRFREDQEE
jgi:predicted GTPase